MVTLPRDDGKEKKTYKVSQKYQCVQSQRTGAKMPEDMWLPLGRYQAQTITDAIRQAAKEWRVPALLLHATLVNEEEEESTWTL